MSMRPWYLIIDHEQKPVASCTQVDLPPNARADDLRRKVKEENPDVLAGVGAASLKVWKVENPQVVKEDEELLEYTPRIQLYKNGGAGPVDNAPAARSLSPAAPLSNGIPFEADKLSFLVQMPSVPGVAPDDPGELVTPEVLKIYKATFIKVHASGKFQPSDLDRNDISPGSLPENIMDEFTEKLNLIPSTEIIPYLRPNLRELYVVQGVHDVPQGSRPARGDEMHALHSVARSGVEEHWRSGFKELHGASFFFLDLVSHSWEVQGLDVLRGTQPWELTLIVECDNELRTYQPRSDSSIWWCNLPRVLIEVNSGHPPAGGRLPEDHIRMLVQGAAVVRFANSCVDRYKSSKDFILVTFYFTREGKAHRHIMHQKPGVSHAQSVGNNQDTVYYDDKVFDLKDPLNRIHLTRDLYNLMYTFEQEGQKSTPEAELFKTAVIQAARQYKFKSFSFKSSKRDLGDEKDDGGSKRQKTGANTNTGDDDLGQSTSDATDSLAVLRSNGYDVHPDVIVDEAGGKMKVLYQLPDHVHRVYKVPNRNTTFIAKRIKNDSHEVEILQRLNSAKPGSEYIIRILKLIDTPSEQWIILPKLNPVYRMALGSLGDHAAQICSGLLDGLSYIHHLLIAHRDINPANLVVDNTFCLKIIDFEFAIQLNAEDEMVDDHCGTEGWVPPEVNANFNSAYSPIRSDLWSCGCVILYLLDGAGKIEERLRSFATRLMAKAPEQRPLLSEWERVSQVRARSPEDAEARYPKKLRTDYHPSPHLLPRSRDEQDGEGLNRADSQWGVVPPSVMSY